MPLKKSKLILIPALVVFLLSGSCKDSVTVTDAYDKPVIWLNTFEMSFAASEFGPNPSNQTLSVKNTGQGTLNYSIADDADIFDVDWLSISPSSGASTGEIGDHIVSVDKTGLEKREDPYTAKITISGKPVRLKQGEMIIMPANEPHALKAVNRFKMMLTMIKA